MNNTAYTPEAQQQINTAENKLGDAIASLKSQIKNNDEPIVEVIPDDSPDVDVEVDSPAPEQKMDREPRRSEFVKTDDPKVLERINDLYGQVKKSDARNQLILEHNRQLEARLAEYTNKMAEFERNTKNSASDRVESELRSALKMAREEADYDRIDDIENKLLDLRMERRLAEKIQPQEEQQPRINPQQQVQDMHLVHNAHYIQNVAEERDSNGNFVRPYLYDWHPDNDKAVELFESIPKEFAAAGKQVDMKTIIEVLDERMKGKKQRPASSVLSSDGGEAPARNTVRLTQQEIEVAKKMGISPARYAKQKQLLNS